MGDLKCVGELAKPASQHILDHLDNFISFFSITMAGLMTFKSFDTHYLTLERAVPYAMSQHISDHLDNFISFFSITMASLMTFISFDTHYLTLERAVPYVAVGVYNQITH